MEDEGKKDDEKLELDSAGQAIAYISLDQARVLALQHARDNRGFYGRRYAQRELVWEVVSAEETEDYYEVKLSYRPAGEFQGRRGIEQLTIDKTGPIEFRQIISQPRSSRGLAYAIVATVTLAAIVAMLAGIFASGLFTSTDAGPSPGVEEPVPGAIGESVAVNSNTSAQLVSQNGRVTVGIPPGITVSRSMNLHFVAVSESSVPAVPPGFNMTEVFGLSLSVEGQASHRPVELLQPMTITIALSAEDIVLAQAQKDNIVIYHATARGLWTALRTGVDMFALTAKADVWSFSGSGVSSTVSVGDADGFALIIKVRDSASIFTPTPTPIPSVPAGGLIAFESDRNERYEIYTMNADGSNQTNVTQSPGAIDVLPAWSPDGAKIAFSRGRGDGTEIYVMNADGSNQVNLTNNSALDTNASWSPDGTKLAFATNRDGNFEIYVMNADGSNQVRLTTNTDEDGNVNWCSADDKLVFTFEFTNPANKDVYVMDAVDSDGDGNGENLIRLTNNAAHDLDPQWSPDCSKIAFGSHRDDSFGEIYVMDAVDSDGDGNGDNLIRLVNNPAVDADPAWSPDGNRIAFYSNRGANWDIYVMDVVDSAGDGNGDNLIRLTNNPADDIRPDWGR